MICASFVDYIPMKLNPREKLVRGFDNLTGELNTMSRIGNKVITFACWC